MSARLVRTRNFHAVGFALAVLMLCLASGAQAAVYTGSATDRSGDLGLDVGDTFPSPRVDFTGVSVRYDDATGRLDASFTFNRAPASGQRLDASVALGFLGAGGSCSTGEFRSRDWHWLEDAGAPRGQAAVTGESTDSRAR